MLLVLLCFHMLLPNRSLLVVAVVIHLQSLRILNVYGMLVIIIIFQVILCQIQSLSRYANHVKVGVPTVLVVVHVLTFSSSLLQVVELLLFNRNYIVAIE